MEFARTYLQEVSQIAQALDPDQLDSLAGDLAEVRARGGRIFFLGVGGSAANASHAVNDFRKLCGFEAYAPTDNQSELTARTNDEGWGSVFEAWLKVSRLSSKDGVFVLSVGGGHLEKNVSPNLVSALRYSSEVGADIFAIVGRDGGFAATVARCAVIIPTVEASRVTPHQEEFQAVVWHLLVSHPSLKTGETKW